MLRGEHQTSSYAVLVSRAQKAHSLPLPSANMGLFARRSNGGVDQAVSVSEIPDGASEPAVVESKPSRMMLRKRPNAQVCTARSTTPLRAHRSRELVLTLVTLALGSCVRRPCPRARFWLPEQSQETWTGDVCAQVQTKSGTILPSIRQLSHDKVPSCTACCCVLA